VRKGLVRDEARKEGTDTGMSGGPARAAGQTHASSMWLPRSAFGHSACVVSAINSPRIRVALSSPAVLCDARCLIALPFWHASASPARGGES